MESRCFVCFYSYLPSSPFFQSTAVDSKVGHINSVYGSMDYHPIQYMYHSVNFTELCALYALADALLITSLRDGMNLVSEEYIACQRQRNGVLIISEFAGVTYLKCSTRLA